MTSLLCVFGCSLKQMSPPATTGAANVQFSKMIVQPYVIARLHVTCTCACKAHKVVDASAECNPPLRKHAKSTTVQLRRAHQRASQEARRSAIAEGTRHVFVEQVDYHR